MAARIIMKLRVVDVQTTCPGVRLYSFRHPRRERLPQPMAGAHVDLHLPDGWVRQYSLCGDPADAGQYRIAVKHEARGRGGSQWIHEHLATGTVVPVSAPRNHFALAGDAAHHVLVGGGIGITPLLAMAYQLDQVGASFVLHHCATSEATAPLLDELRHVCGPRLHPHFSNSLAGRLDVGRLLSHQAPGTHVYCCGPDRLVTDVVQATAHWPSRQVHVERFAAPDDDAPAAAFELCIASTGRVLQVPADRSALSVLRDNGFPLASSCGNGLCGVCECRYLSGTVLHRDLSLDSEARRSALLPCVSRGRGRVVLAL